jgi:hypothetical protein
MSGIPQRSMLVFDELYISIQPVPKYARSAKRAPGIAKTAAKYTCYYSFVQLDRLQQNAHAARTKKRNDFWAFPETGWMAI